MNTSDLLNALRQTRDFDGFCRRQSETFLDETLSDYLPELMESHGVSKTELIERAGLEKGYAYQIFRGIRNPSRDRLIQIALGLGCTLDETQKLFRLGLRNELYTRVRRDAAILFCLTRQYTVAECQAFLRERQLEPLRD